MLKFSLVPRPRVGEKSIFSLTHGLGTRLAKVLASFPSPAQLSVAWGEPGNETTKVYGQIE